MTRPEDDHTSTVEGAAGFEAWRSRGELHPPGCDCRACLHERALDEVDPWER